MPEHVHMHRDPTQAPGRIGAWVSEGKERNRHRTTVRKGEKLLRRTLLGRRLRDIREQEAADGASGQF